jgi:hypothetical protein
MKIDEIKTIARQKRVKAGKLTKREVVQAIQLAEGNSPCFNTKSSEFCGQASCLWRAHCD